jgi:hypothetical protein
LLSNLTGECVTDGDVSEIPTPEQIVAEEIEENANSEFIDFTTFDDPIPEVKEVKEKATKVSEEPKPKAIENAVVENGQIEAGF